MSANFGDDYRGAAGVRGMPVLGIPESGPLWGSWQQLLMAAASCLWWRRRVAGCVVSGQVSGHTTRGGKLKIWKPEKLTAGSPAQIARLPGFKDFRYLPTPPPPESCRLSPTRRWPERGMTWMC